MDMHTIKPLDTDILKKDVKLVVSVGRTQYHWRVGKCDSRSVKYIFCSCALLRLGIGDYFSQVGEYEYLLEQHGLSPEHIANTIENNL